MEYVATNNDLTVIVSEL